VEGIIQIIKKSYGFYPHKDGKGICSRAIVAGTFEPKLESVGDIQFYRISRVTFLRVKARKKGDMVEITVKDTGVGIKPEDKINYSNLPVM
jgi:hypothetical protein